MRKRSKKSDKRRIIDTCIYCASVIMLFFAVILFMQEYAYVPQEVYTDPPPAAPKETTAQATPMPYQYPTYTYSPAPSASELLTPYITPAQTQEIAPTPTKAPSTPAPTEPLFADGELHPVKLYFIEHKISCNIKPVGINSKYEMGTIRSPYDAGWLYAEPYVLPGDVGKAVIAGHNRWGGHNGTFSVLKKMQVGETVAVEMSDGYARYFRVDELTECAYDDNTIMTPVYDRAVLVLITCKGDWDSVLHASRTRVIAICSPIEGQGGD